MIQAVATAFVASAPSPTHTVAITARHCACLPYKVHERTLSRMPAPFPVSPLSDGFHGTIGLPSVPIPIVAVSCDAMFVGSVPATSYFAIFARKYNVPSL